MALVKMRKLTLLAFLDDRKELIRALSKTRCTEVKEIEKSELLSTINNSSDKDVISLKLAKYSAIISLFKENKREVEKYQKLLAKVKQMPTLLLRENGENLLREAIMQPLSTMPADDYAKLIKTTKDEEQKQLLVDTDVARQLDEKGKQIVYPIASLSILSKHEVIESYKGVKKPMIAPYTRITFDEFEGIATKEVELDSVIDTVNEKKSAITELLSQKTKLNATIDNLMTYIDVDVAMNAFVDTKNSSFLLGTIPTGKIDSFRELIEVRDCCTCEVFERERFSAVAIACLKQNKEEILSALIAVDYAKCAMDFPMTPSEKIKEVRESIFDIETEMLRLNFEIAQCSTNLDNIKTLYDFYALELQKLLAQEKCGATGKTFLLEAWLPHDREESVSSAISAVGGTVAFEFSDAKDGEIVPTLTANNNFVAPYEAVTNMYSIPDPREIDPNPFVSVFFFIFFGVMMSDAGYGLILTIISFILIKIIKPRKGEAKLLYIILMGGISTIFWGVMFGGYFAIEAPWIKPLLFNPLENPLPMLGLSLGLGVVQIMCGMGIQAYAYIKAGKFWDAVFDIFSWYSIFIGIAMLALKFLLKLDVFMTIGLVFIAIGVGLLIVFGGRKKKGFGRVVGGFGKLYGIMNFLSDILSYSRLFGLGLASGVVGMVVNKIGLVIIDLVPFVGILFALPIFLIGHVFNISIGILGAYVHNCRLQYIEFFSRFYTGSGHQFVPLATNIKYTKID